MGCATLHRIGTSIAVMLVAGVALSGCAGQEVEFEGKVFDVVGLSGIGKPKQDKQIEARAPLVMPPSKQLPEPGPKEQVASPNNWPVDPDERRKQDLADQKDALERYYREGDFTDRAGIEEFEHITGKWDRRPGVLSKKANEAIEEGRQATPEDGSGGQQASQ
jgi:hypothetical protein